MLFLIQIPSYFLWTFTALIFLGIGNALIGSFLFLQKKSLLGDVVSHSILPGICLAFILSGEKNPIYLFMGALVFALLSILSIQLIQRFSKLASDAALSVVLAFFFGSGMFLLSIIQNSGMASQSGLNNFIFGQAAALQQNDVYLIVFIVLLVCFLLILFYKGFSLLSFDKTFSQSIGLPVFAYELLFSTLTVLIITVGIQAVGIVLMAAFLISPPVAARLWTHKLKPMLFLAILFGILSAIGGGIISSSFSKTPTGPWIIVFMSFFVVLSFLFSFEQGWISKMIFKINFYRMIENENMLKRLYHLSEKNELVQNIFSLNELKNGELKQDKRMMKILNRLIRKNFVIKVDAKYTLSKEGNIKAKRIARFHRLWEMYMSKYMNIPSDHVHETAEKIEHLIQPWLEHQLLEELNYPKKDPHNTQIPYDA